MSDSEYESFADLLSPHYVAPVAPVVSAPSKDPAIIAAHMENLTIDGVIANYPLRFAIENIKAPIVESIIMCHHALDPASIQRPFASGGLPVQVATQKRNMRALTTLLRLGAVLVRDTQNTNNPGTDGELTCTCGACAGGWLSKRMRFRLKCQAAFSKDMMQSELDTQFKNGVAHPDPTDLVDNTTSSLPQHLHGSVFKTFYLGYQSIFVTIFCFLDKTDLPLSQQAIARRIHSQPGVRFYLDKGGKIEYALDAITGNASELDDVFEEVWLDEDDAYTSLPRCANDLALRWCVKSLVAKGDIDEGTMLGVG